MNTFRSTPRPRRVTIAVVAAITMLAFQRLSAIAADVPPSQAPNPAATPTPERTPLPYERYVGVDLVLAPRVTNELTPPVTGTTTQDLRAGLEYRFLGRNFFEYEYRRFRYDGGRTEEQAEFHTSVAGIGHAYLATSTFARGTTYGVPHIHSSFGFGAQLLPELERPFSVSAAYYYYPEAGGTSTVGGTSTRLRYKVQTADLRAQYSLTGTATFLEIGVYGDRYLPKEHAAIATHGALELGLGLRL